jgi:hypothetical protein
MMSIAATARRTFAREKRKPRCVPSVSRVHLVLDGDRGLPCDMLEISLEGLSVKTTRRPTLGEIVKLGNMQDFVMRHRDGGMAIAFVAGAGDKKPIADRKDLNGPKQALAIQP